MGSSNGTREYETQGAASDPVEGSRVVLLGLEEAFLWLVAQDLLVMAGTVYGVWQELADQRGELLLGMLQAAQEAEAKAMVSP